jgi:hypothetical protein
MNSPFLIQGLISEGYSYLGMISEAQSKCLILKEKAQRSDCDQNPDLHDSLAQINEDIDRYSVKLMNLCNKLRQNGAIH